MEIILKGEKFILRPLARSDARSLSKSAHNKKIYENTLRIPYPYTLEEAKKWIEKNIREGKKKEPKMINFAIDINGEVAGMIGFSGIEKKHKAEAGYWIGEKYWGQGIMSEAIKVADEFAFKKLGLVKITAHVFSFNKASCRVLEKNGYKLEGKLEKEVKKDGELIDVFLFGKIRKQ